MNYGSPNLIEKSMLTEIKKNQTAIIISRECEETMVVVNNTKYAYGAECHIIKETEDFNKIEKLCRQTGFPRDFVYLGTAATGEVYITMECADSLPVAICVKEIDGHLKLCKVLVQDYREEKNNELTM